mmetsp:Transcript_33153/g.48607  ORF Transcript_33153/g.48607 Transcript_33153/m.48607 type:complete len:188 (-) Transcript_33153:184-747(-)|eukprot:CAMPEP_0195518500 /NCGR_PEP_ID=MMETSP0794_2-20130614/13016_1 /TAXON_ID=515487 /ORGANISM="Stephanopyxis turris, Strain CCMP 815" /LENGTH=187 /DNA_ID=CAMNT_0040647471 /DNA_START=90 /DNA_END=653 /DNA_ORIENTATION=+
MVALPPKFFKALVSGVVKMNILNDPAITPDFIVDQIFTPNKVSSDDAAGLTAAVAEIVATAAKGNLTVAELEKVLSKKAAFSAEQNDAFLSAWKSDAPKVHAKNVADSDHTPGLVKQAWRVDVTTQSRNASELNEASAIIQLTTGTNGQAAGSFQFEMNRGELSALLGQLNDINDAVQKRAGATKSD